MGRVRFPDSVNSTTTIKMCVQGACKTLHYWMGSVYSTLTWKIIKGSQPTLILKTARKSNCWWSLIASVRTSHPSESARSVIPAFSWSQRNTVAPWKNSMKGRATWSKCRKLSRTHFAKNYSKTAAAKSASKDVFTKMERVASKIIRPLTADWVIFATQSSQTVRCTHKRAIAKVVTQDPSLWLANATSIV